MLNIYQLKEKFYDEYMLYVDNRPSGDGLRRFTASKAGSILNNYIQAKFGSMSFNYDASWVGFPIVRFGKYGEAKRLK